MKLESRALRRIARGELRSQVAANTKSVTRILFVLCYSHCTSDCIDVYAGPTPSSALLKTYCERKKGSVVHVGKDMLVEFRSGPEVAPFDYNGFVATLTFVELTTEAPTTTTLATTTTTRASGSAVQSSSCRLLLLGRNYDTVHVSIANYNLSTTFCKSQIEVFDGLLDEKSSTNAKPIAKICGPASESQHQKQNSPHDYVEKNRYSSSSRNMTIVLTRASDEDYMDVSYYFHNDRESGTQQPKTLCDVEYYGLSSPNTGTVVHPKTNTISKHAQCKQHFIPAANQAVIITLNSTMNQTREDSQCTTQCGDQGCRCASDKSLDNIDHLLLVSRTHGNTLACLCGNNRDWLPVEFWSTTPVYIEWSRSSHVGLNLTAEYKFAEDSFCGSHEAEKLEGEIHAGYSAKFSFALNHYYQQKCTYIIESPPNRDLVIQIESSQTRPCTAWNITVQEYNKTTRIADGPRLYTFCPRDIARNFTIAQDIRAVMVKLQALGRTAPQYVLKWRNVPANSTRNTRDRHSMNSIINVAMASASGRSLVASPIGCLLAMLLRLATT
ncbi:hypothetical protein TSAR_006466 [Trichomalopsis sarcophagae]|uniref:CUB domain-containing protein n=1 Tax=Trichomalopsis sarcophagae TaxID=543379 RepID=A0A232FN16_9HYME|nr:hypothetical protein TSAR_006466 [Trichomalopsis sarcophagae]